jgi:peptidyl-prolyl cis-trans isomerase D
MPIALFLPSSFLTPNVDMSVIQKIRDKYSRIAVIAIAVALTGFILIDYISGKSRGLFTSNSTTVGKVNGTPIDERDFDRKVKQSEDYLQQQYRQTGDVVHSQAIEQVWDEEVNRILIKDEIDKLGMVIGKKELNDILFGPDAPDDIKKAGTDPQTGQYNPAMAAQQINAQKKRWSQEVKNQFNEYVDGLEFLRQAQKFNSLLSSSINFPRWFFEKQNGDNSQMAKISLVRKVFTEIPDSSIKITDKEIEDYLSKHKSDYKQEESRSIAYVAFSAAPSPSDSADAKNKLLALKTEFDTTKDVKAMLLREGLGNNYYPGYVNGKTIQIPVKDSIFKTPVGHTYGPYLDGSNYVLAKMEGSKPMADTVKVRHILVATSQRDPQSGQTVQTRDTAQAFKLADSIRLAIKNGANFDTLCLKLSDDQGKYDQQTKAFTGGVYDNVTSGQMVPEFNDFIFLNPTGTKGIVKTDFGYHYIEILSQKGSGGTGYKIAYLSKPITASTETDNNASNQASLFAGDSRDQKSFDANYEKNLKPKGINKGVGPDIAPTSAFVPGLGASRQFVRDIYKAKRGSTLDPQRVGESYVVAIVTEINDKGTMSLTKARMSIEPLLRNKKKAEQIKQKLGNITTLEAAASALGKQIETIDSVRMSGAQGIGYEPIVVGAAFNPNNKGKVVPQAIEGRSGVYVERVDDVTTTPIANANVADERKNAYDQRRQFAQNPQAPGYPANILKKAATIRDNRADKY